MAGRFKNRCARRFSKDDITTVVLAAGSGSRMRPVTDWIPKPLVPVDGEPILVTNLRSLAQCGFTRVVVVYGPATRQIPEFLGSIEVPDLALSFAYQAEPRGTGDALLVGMSTGHLGQGILLMAGDAVYSPDHIDALWTAFLEHDGDGAVLLKRVSKHRLQASSLVIQDGAGMIVAMIPKPSLRQIREYDGELADASLHIYSCAIGQCLRSGPLSATNELEVSAALTAWIGEGARIAGVVARAPLHVTGVDDFVAHTVPAGRRLVVAAEFERAILERSDEDLTHHFEGLSGDDIQFVHGCLMQLNAQPIEPTKRARCMALMSEMCRRHVAASSIECDTKLEEWAGQMPVDEFIDALRHELRSGNHRPAVYHHLASAHTQQMNTFVGDAVFAEASSQTRGFSRTPKVARDRVVVRTPARLSFSSSQGSDISYIIEEKSALILNCAISVGGELPGKIEIKRIAEPQIQLVANDMGVSGPVLDFETIFGPLSVDDPLVLLKSALRHSGIVTPEHAETLGAWIEEFGTGLRVTAECNIPIGSGLGCSALLAAAIIAGLREFAGLETTDTELLLRSYCCERAYGRSGWQDILGGIAGGVKLIHADAHTGMFSPQVEPLSLTQDDTEAISRHVIAFHTGRAHVSTPYLLTIPAQYFLRGADYMYAYENGKRLTRSMVDALRMGSWERMGELVSDYWDDREFFEDGVTPSYVRQYRRDLAPISHGTALCGSGHGGYLMVVVAEEHRDAVMEYIASQGIGSDAVLDFAVVNEGLVIETQ